MICFQKIYGFHALNHQIIEISWDVTPVSEIRRVESRAVFCLSRIRNRIGLLICYNVGRADQWAHILTKYEIQNRSKNYKIQNEKWKIQNNAWWFAITLVEPSSERTFWHLPLCRLLTPAPALPDLMMMIKMIMTTLPFHLPAFRLWWWWCRGQVSK